MKGSKWLYVILTFQLLMCILPTVVGAECYSDTKTFNPNQGYSWNVIWTHTIPDIPESFVVSSAELEIRAKVWAWGFYPNPARMDILCSDTNVFYANDPAYFVCSLTPATHPNPSQFYTVNCSLKQNQIEWLLNDNSLYFEIIPRQRQSPYE